MVEPLQHIEPGKILIATTLGIVATANNLTEANKLAKELATKYRKEFVVYAPKTGYAPETPPIKRKRYTS